MTLFCLLATLTSLSCATWVTKYFFLSASNHNARFWNPNLGLKNTISKHAFVAAPAEIRNPTECIAVCLLGWPRPDAQAPPRISSSALWDLCYWCTLALDQSVCQQNGHRHFVACLRLLVSSTDSKSNTMICGKVSVFFFGYSCLLLKSCSQHSISSKPSSRIACLLSNVRANCISLVSPLLPCFVFSKATTSFPRPGKHLGQQCQRQAWNWNKVFVSVQKPSTGCPGRLLSLPWPHIW